MKRLSMFFLIALCWHQARGDILNVPSSENLTIQSAINDANNGDTIIVSPGSYRENINFLGKAITLTSQDPNNPNIVAATIIDGNQPADPNIGSVVTFMSGEDGNSVLRGFTIQNGTGQTDPTVTWRTWNGNNGDGGGIICTGASPTITQNVIKNCRAEYGGGGIFCHNMANPVITHNTFINNFAGWYGGAIFARLKCSPVISDNIIKGNKGYYLGGAIYLADQCHARIISNRLENNNCQILFGGALYYFVNCSPIVACNLFIGNTCSGGGNNGATGAAISTWATTAGKIINNTFTGNYCTNLNGVVIRVGEGSTELIANNIIYSNGNVGISTWSNANPIIRNNDVWNNAGGNYGGTIGDQTGINGNISVDPKVTSDLPAPFTSFELNPSSPCINTGDNNSLPGWITSDYDGTSRIVNGVVDMGPQEYDLIGVPQDYNTIQQAVNAAQSGDQIVVSPGLYRENINFLTKNIRLRSFNPLDPNCVSQTIIDGNDTDSCIKILSGQDANTAVAGLRLQNGHGVFGGGVLIEYSTGPVVMYNHIVNNKAIKPAGATTGGYGGGVDCRFNAYAEVRNNTISGNYASVAGGGVHVGPGSTCRITNNKITNNITIGEAGGGIYTYDGTTAWIIGNEILDNQAQTANGGGIWQWGSPGGVIEDNIIVGNVATPTSPGNGEGSGGGIGIIIGATLIRNNIISGNRADQGGGIWIQTGGTCKVMNNTIVGNITNYSGAGIGVAYNVYSPIINNIIAYNGPGGGVYVKPYHIPSEPNLVANDIWNNIGGDFLGDINDLTGINGNISADPCFIDAGGWSDNNTPADPNDDYWVQGDYHIIFFSPCRDAGSNTDAPDKDFEGDHRPSFGQFDIGADEVPTDNFSGLGTLAQYWLIGGISQGDLDNNGIVDFRDFAILAAEWLE